MAALVCRCRARGQRRPSLLRGPLRRDGAERNHKFQSLVSASSRSLRLHSSTWASRSAATLSYGAVQVEISEDMQLVHFDLNRFNLMQLYATAAF